MTILDGRTLLKYIPAGMRKRLVKEFGLIDLIDVYPNYRPKNTKEKRQCKNLEKLKILERNTTTGTYQTSPIIHRILDDYAP